MKMLKSAALCLGLLAIGATGAEASNGEHEARDEAEIRVVNNHTTAVRVFAEIDGRQRYLGRVERAQVKFLALTATPDASVRLEFHPLRELGVRVETGLLGGPAIRTVRFDLRGDAVNVYLESDLLRSSVERSAE